MARSRRRYNRNRELGIRNRVRGIIKKAHDLAQCYGVDVDMHIQLENNFAAGYQSEPGLGTKRTTIPKDQLFGPEDFVSQNEKYHQLFSTQLPGRSVSALSSASSASNFPLLPCVLPTRANYAQSAYIATPCDSNTPPLTADEVTTTETIMPSQLTPSTELNSAIRVSRATTSPPLVHTASISTQQAKEILDLVHKFF